MMGFEVELLYYVCRWCGAPYALPKAFAENAAVTKRCPNGHAYYSSRSVEEELSDANERAANLADELVRADRTIRSLKGALTKAKRPKESHDEQR